MGDRVNASDQAASRLAPMGFDPSRCDMAALRHSVELESQADLMAVAGNFGEASRLMTEANRIRRRQFGPFDPNALRELTAIARAEGIAQKGSQ